MGLFTSMAQKITETRRHKRTHSDCNEPVDTDELKREALAELNAWRQDLIKFDDELATLRQPSATLQEYLAEFQTAMKNDTDLLQKGIEARPGKEAEYHKSTQFGAAKCRRRLNQYLSDLKVHVKNVREQCFQSLDYREHESKLRTLGPQHPSTFEWILKPGLGRDAVPCGRQDKLPARGCSFVDWLRSSDSLYWIGGKAGSGKTYMMASLAVHGTAANKEVLDYLQEWAGGEACHLFYYFFWASGTDLQKSLEGFLRRMLYRIFPTVPNGKELIMTQRTLRASTASSWHIEALKSTLVTALSSVSEHFCFFVDGLDEFDGDIGGLFDVLFIIQDLPNVKICVSSRSEPLLSERLSQYPSLQMEDFNRGDINSLVRDGMQGLEEKWIDKVVSQADGSFLWADLAARLLTSEFSNRYDEGVLEKRLRELSV